MVTNNDDPEKLGRVRVQFPTLSADDESAWARIATPGGGKERGLQWLPEVDDEVLVGFELDDHDPPGGARRPVEPHGQAAVRRRRRPAAWSSSGCWPAARTPGWPSTTTSRPSR